MVTRQIWLPAIMEVDGRRLVWFATNDPSQPWVEMRITANVR